MQPPKCDVRRIGLDLDNTLIDYSSAYAHFAPDFGITALNPTREVIRTQLRLGDDRDERWQEFQSRLYTEGLKFAQPAPALSQLMTACAEASIEVVAVSHKTKRGPELFGALDLRGPAEEWILAYATDLLPLTRERIHFADTLEAKVEQISVLQLDVFIDDLPRVLQHADWPSSTFGIHYQRGPWLFDDGLWHAGFEQVADWLVPTNGSQE